MPKIKLSKFANNVENSNQLIRMDMRDIYQPPTEDQIAQAIEGEVLNIGDLNGNSAFMINILVRNGILKFANNEDYMNYMELCKEDMPCMIVVNEKWQAEKGSLSPEQQQNNLNKRNAIIERCKPGINIKKLKLRFMGDIFSDRVADDPLLLLIFSKLQYFGVKYEIMLSDHDAFLLSSLDMFLYVVKNDTKQSVNNLNDNKWIKPLQYLVANNVVDQKFIIEKMNQVIIPNYKLISYALITDKTGKTSITLFSHGVINADIIIAICKALKINIEWKNKSKKNIEAVEIAKTIDDINSFIQQPGKLQIIMDMFVKTNTDFWNINHPLQSILEENIDIAIIQALAGYDRKGYIISSCDIPCITAICHGHTGGVLIEENKNNNQDGEIENIDTDNVYYKKRVDMDGRRLKFVSIMPSDNELKVLLEKNPNIAYIAVNEDELYFVKYNNHSLVKRKLYSCNAKKLNILQPENIETTILLTPKDLELIAKQSGHVPAAYYSCEYRSYEKIGNNGKIINQLINLREFYKKLQTPYINLISHKKITLNGLLAPQILQIYDYNMTLAQKYEKEDAMLIKQGQQIQDKDDIVKNLLNSIEHEKYKYEQQKEIINKALTTNFINFQYQNGDKYEGEWRDNKPCGVGIMTYVNGDKYEGEWKNNLYDGYGIITLVNGKKYKGGWKKGCYDGHGIMILANGDQCEGSWKKNKFDGYGVATYVDGDTYEGEWKNNNYNGYGVKRMANGDQVKGNWQNGVFINGNGIITYKNGNKYKGEIKGSQNNDIYLDGVGIMIYIDGDKYEGKFKNSKPYEKGCFSFINGSKFECDIKDTNITGDFLYEDKKYQLNNIKNGSKKDIFNQCMEQVKQDNVLVNCYDKK